MKTCYFTPENISGKSSEIIRYISEHVRLRERKFNPGTSALLVLDMQKYFLDESSHAWIPSSAVISEKITLLIEKFREINRPVIFTRHLNTEENAGMMGKWWRELMLKENELTEISEKFSPETGEIVIKNSYDAFHNTSLKEILLKKRCDNVVICGVMTHLCCDTTARSAFINGFEVFFTVDGTTTYNEELHRASLLGLAHGFASVVQINELIKQIDKWK